MKWNVIKKSFRFSLKINLTSTKIMAWYLGIMTWILAFKVPEEAIAYFVISMAGIIVFLYTGKNIQEYLKKKNKIEEEEELE